MQGVQAQRGPGGHALLRLRAPRRPWTSTGGPNHACMMVAVRVAIWRRGWRSRPPPIRPRSGKCGFGRLKRRIEFHEENSGIGSGQGSRLTAACATNLYLFILSLHSYTAPHFAMDVPRKSSFRPPPLSHKFPSSGIVRRRLGHASCAALHAVTYTLGGRRTLS